MSNSWRTGAKKPEMGNSFCGSARHGAPVGIGPALRRAAPCGRTHPPTKSPKRGLGPARAGEVVSGRVERGRWKWWFLLGRGQKKKKLKLQQMGGKKAALCKGGLSSSPPWARRFPPRCCRVAFRTVGARPLSRNVPPRGLTKNQPENRARAGAKARGCGWRAKAGLLWGAALPAMPPQLLQHPPAVGRMGRGARGGPRGDPPLWQHPQELALSRHGAGSGQQDEEQRHAAGFRGGVARK